MTPAPDDRAARAARSGAAVAAAVLVALGAHLAGGGAAPAPVLLVAVLALAWPAGLLLVGRRPSLPRQAAVVGVAQAMLHGLFALGGGVPAASADVGTTGMAGMHGAALPLVAPMPHTAGMQWSHLLAGAVTVLAWRRGESVLRGLLRRIAVRRLLAVLPPVPTAAGERVRVDVHLPVSAVLPGAHRDRGPPLPA